MSLLEGCAVLIPSIPLGLPLCAQVSHTSARRETMTPPYRYTRGARCAPGSKAAWNRQGGHLSALSLSFSPFPLMSSRQSPNYSHTYVRVCIHICIYVCVHMYMYIYTQRGIRICTFLGLASIYEGEHATFVLNLAHLLNVMISSSIYIFASAIISFFFMAE
jgi:hypothetical protein